MPLWFTPETQHRILLTLALWLLLGITRFFLQSWLRRRIEDPTHFHRWRKTVTYTEVALGLLGTSLIWARHLQNLATFLGLLSAGAAIALRDPLVNLVGWLFILLRRPFEIGDRIAIGDYRGDVIDLRLFQFSILEIGGWVQAEQSTGRIVHLPNSIVFTHPVANYSQPFPFIWNEIPVLLTFESNWRKAKELLTQLVQQHAAQTTEQAQAFFQRIRRRYPVKYAQLTPTVYTEVRDSGVLLTLRYLCPVRQRRDSTQALWEAILDLVAEHPDIELAYPTQRVVLTHPTPSPRKHLS